MEKELREKCEAAGIPVSIQKRGGASVYSGDIIATLSLGGGRTFSTDVPSHTKSDRYIRLMATLDLMAQMTPSGFILTKVNEDYNNTACRVNIGTRAKIEFTVKSDHNSRVDRVSMTSYFRNSSGAYVADANTLNRSESWDKALALAGKIAKDLSERTPPKITRPKIAGLPTPHQFKDADDFVIARGGLKWTRNMGTIHLISVAGLYGLDDKGRLSEASNPDVTDIWFLVNCTNVNHDRAPTRVQFQIIFNGDGWYQVVQSGQRLKATGDTAKGKSLNLLVLSTVDRELIEHAISRYVA